MKPIYAVLNKNERDEFEKKYQVPFGYSKARVFFDLSDAIGNFKEQIGFLKTLGTNRSLYEDLIIEKVTELKKEIVYKYIDV